MEKYFALSDSEFDKRFENCKLDPVVFSHEAHLRLAWVHIDRYGLKEAERNIQAQHKKFVEFGGELYHRMGCWDYPYD